MLLTLLTCSAWTTWLIVAALAPNETANWLMSTGAYNNGQFWLISDKTRVSSSLARLVLLSLMLATCSKRKFSNVSSKALNLAMQVLPVVLLHLLESGAPEVFVLGYACLVAINSLSCALNIFYGKLSAVAEVVISSVFDWFVTVAYPILVLIYLQLRPRRLQNVSGETSAKQL
ncbi:hypothetical protein PF003_g34669 [Phytophthora fragariae]|nr:hypothetical protein PF003_g34669 [Phytophthora fragariae]